MKKNRFPTSAINNLEAYELLLSREKEKILKFCKDNNSSSLNIRFNTWLKYCSSNSESTSNNIEYFLTTICNDD